MKKYILFSFLILFLLNISSVYANDRGSIGELFDSLDPSEKRVESNGETSKFRLNGANIKDKTVTSAELEDNIEIENLKVNTLNAISGDIELNSQMVLNGIPSNNNHVVNKAYVDNILTGIQTSLTGILDVLKKLTIIIATTTDTNTRVRNLEMKLTETNNKLTNIENILNSMSGSLASGGRRGVYKSDGVTRIGDFLGFFDYVPTGDFNYIERGEGIEYLDNNGKRGRILPIDRLTFKSNLGLYYRSNDCTGRADFKKLNRGNQVVFDYKNKKTYKFDQWGVPHCWGGERIDYSYYDNNGDCITTNARVCSNYENINTESSSPEKLCGWGNCVIK